MADELNKSAEFSGKHQDEENPILVAQRYLNIYRQIHIFNKKRQDEFDDSLLKMPSDIRILLSTLPGGSLLLEHISDLEEKKGIIPDALLNSKVSETTSNSDEKSYITAKSVSKNADNAALSNNLIKILQQNEEKHAKDLQALTNAFLKSQENMTAILKQALNTKPEEEAQSSPLSAPKQETKQPAKPETKQEEIVQNEPQEEHKDAPEEAPIADTASKILSFTKKLFTSSKEDEPENTSQSARTPDSKVAMPVVDHTPVSLDDIEAAPVSLDVAEDTSFSPQVQTAQPDEIMANTESSDNGDWEWEYVDDDGTTDDEEWEYIADENENLQNDQWEYVEDPNGEYAYEYPASDDNTEWEYVEENADGADGQYDYSLSTDQSQT